MKKFIYGFWILSSVLLSCSTTNQNECQSMMCTQEFRMIQVKFVEPSGDPVIVKDFTAINSRTGESTVQNNDPVTSNNQGNYVVASDADVKKLSAEGDTIRVSAIHHETNKRVEADFVITGGPCACHVNKVSGPEQITF